MNGRRRENTVAKHYAKHSRNWLTYVQSYKQNLLAWFVTMIDGCCCCRNGVIKLVLELPDTAHCKYPRHWAGHSQGCTADDTSSRAHSWRSPTLAVHASLPQCLHSTHTRSPKPHFIELILPIYHGLVLRMQQLKVQSEDIVCPSPMECYYRCSN